MTLKNIVLALLMLALIISLALFLEYYYGINPEIIFAISGLIAISIKIQSQKIE